MLHFHNVHKSYGGETVLRIADLRLDTGIYWVKGANGSGKSTLLRMVAGLIPFQGDIGMDNTSQKKEPVSYRRLVSWSDAEPVYPSFLPGIDLVRLYCSLRKCTPKDADDLIGRFGMGDYIHQATGSYSSGMLKKLSLVLAFLGNARLIILDEPLITLDEAALRTLRTLIRERNSTSGTGFLMSSHQQPDGELAAAKQILVADQNVSLQ